MLSRRRDWAEPTDRRRTDRVHDDPLTTLDDFVFLRRCNVGQHEILSVRMAGDFMTAFVQFFYRFRKQFSAPGVETNGRGDLYVFEDSHESPDPGSAAIA